MFCQTTKLGFTTLQNGQQYSLLQTKLDLLDLGWTLQDFRNVPGYTTLVSALPDYKLSWVINTLEVITDF